ncbi:phosphoenolpyruvate carboxykinase (GTP) [Candidatus Woesearchaeota archaeon]|nr:phosphoenolpyruvate carboxykinase (GTP) [Candidatus Woesearchaeota archaeon]
MSELLTGESLKKLEALKNPHVMNIVKKYIGICRPAKVTVVTDSAEDINYVRELALKKGEEKKLAMKGHTVHFDGYYDQGRDKEVTKVLMSGNLCLSKVINCGNRDECLEEIFGFMEGIMEGKEMLIRFFCLGPTGSVFSIPSLQITDSAYVAHSEELLYRQGYEQFKKLKGSSDFFHFVHSAGRLDEKGSSLDVDKKRIYIDIEGDRVLTVNNQYAGNSVGLKKLALRLAIKKAHQEDWLCEHMFIMGVHPEGKKRVTYFTGAFPSACGKTSTAMIPGQTIIGDDIAYIRVSHGGRAKAVNVERGIFGIIQDVNPIDDPLIYKTLTTEREVIFSNVLVKDKIPYWLGMGKEIPKEGFNFSGEWKEGKKGPDGKEVPPAHKNARYTIKISELENADPHLEDPKGVPVQGIIYGGRDSDTSVPVCQALSWHHGVFLGACLESETTAATIGQEGIRVHNPMANIDFLVVPLSVYIQNHIKFGEKLDKPPLVFTTNYFLKKDGKFMNEKTDKKVWLMWMEGRAHEEFHAIETPIGYIPKYKDLKMLFKQIFDKDYTEEEYNEQFMIRTSKLIERFERVRGIYNSEQGIPHVFIEHLEQQEKRLRHAKERFGKENILPHEFEE